MLHYILQTVAFQLFFLIIYDVFLKNETFFNWNRAYLLLTSVASVSLPFVKLESMRTIVPQDFVIRLPEVIVGDVTPVQQAIPVEVAAQAIQTSQFVWSWDYLLYLGMIVATLILLFKIFKISRLIEKNPKHWKGDLLVVHLMKSNSAFSFFHYVFIGEYIKDEERDAILAHESVHVQQKHTLDLMLFEIFRIVFWFNPLVYMYQNRMTILHEYIADAKAVKKGDKAQYYQNLLSQVFHTQQISFTNTFYKQSLIKKRIVMLSKAKSNRINLFKYALLIPMVFGMLIYTSCQQENDIEKSEYNLEQYSYTLKMPVKMSDEQEKIHKNYESFLRSHPDYVSWAVIDQEMDEVSYSIHPKTDQVPEGFVKWEVSSPSEGSYTMYINLPSTEREVSSDENKLIAKNYSGAEEIPFSIIDEVPTLEACNGLSSNAEKRQCLSDYISGFIGENFNTSLGKELGLEGRQRIIVQFKIGKDGKIKDVKSRASHPELEEESIRVVNLLPQMIPGKHNGKNVVVPYSLPIVFQVYE